MFQKNQTNKDNVIKELTSFSSLSKRYSNHLPEYNFIQLPKTKKISFFHDNVPYTFCHTNNLFIHENIEEELERRTIHSVKHFKLGIKRHHSIIKKIYELCSGLYPYEDVWVMVGGGLQIQMFYGTSRGYVGTLYLSLDNKEVSDNDNCTFVVNGKENDKIFINNFFIEGVNFRSHKSVFGDN